MNRAINQEDYARSIQREYLVQCVCTHRTPINRRLSDTAIAHELYKKHNLSLAIEKLNGMLIKPGQTFSFWDAIGAPSKKNGYKKGVGLINNQIKNIYGGGLGQLSNMIYWIALHSPLTIVERHRHPYDLYADQQRTQPFGTGATCQYNISDLQFKNETDYTFQIYFEIQNDALEGKLFCNEQLPYTYLIYEKGHKITQNHEGNYVRHNWIYRKIFVSDEIEIKDHLITENHAQLLYHPNIEREEI